jgi:hypothetical protein
MLCCMDVPFICSSCICRLRPESLLAALYGWTSSGLLTWDTAFLGIMFSVYLGFTFWVYSGFGLQVV